MKIIASSQEEADAIQKVLRGVYKTLYSFDDFLVELTEGSDYPGKVKLEDLLCTDRLELGLLWLLDSLPVKVDEDEVSVKKQFPHVF